MAEEPKKENTEEEVENLEELREVIKKIEELQKQQNNDKKPQKKRPKMIAIEFGGVFHHNRYINFVFNFILNFTFAFFVIEIFNFANYHDIVIVAAMILIYSIAEEAFRTYLLIHHFPIILKSFGTIFYFGYLLIFFVLDQYVFIHNFNFINATLLAFFVLIFVLVRYLFSQGIRNYFRKYNVR